MSLEAIQQNTKTILELSDAYEKFLKQKNRRKLKETKNYILRLSNNIRKLVEEERKNVRA